MMINAGSVSEDHIQYIGQVNQEYYARLHHYFLIQLGDASEADECVQETMRHFFFFMEEKQWEEETEFIFDYLMKIAGFLWSRKSIEKRSQRRAGFDDNENHSLLNKIRTSAAETIKKRIAFIGHFLGSVESNSGQPSVM